MTISVGDELLHEWKCLALIYKFITYKRFHNECERQSIGEFKRLFQAAE